MPGARSHGKLRGGGRGSAAWCCCSALLLLLLGLGGLTNATATPPTTPSARSGQAPLTEQETRAARKLYQVKCAKCHKFYPPDQYSDEDWHMWMEKMAKKSKLKPAQSNLLNRYLDNLRTAK